MSATVAKSLEEKIIEWLDANGHKLELDLKEGELQQLTSTIFSYSGPQINISIGFKEPLTKSELNLEELKSKFNYVALDQLPLPGLDVPSNWNVYPQTPMSSFNEGVRLEAYKNDRLHATIETKFSSIYAKQHEEHPIMDQPAAEGTYLQVRRDVDGVIKIDMPLVFI